MDRRSIVMAFASLAAAGSAWAQSNQTPAGNSQSNAMTSDATVGDAEKTYIRDTLQVGTLSLEASRIAVSRAREGMVKQFANFEVAGKKGGHASRGETDDE